MVLPLKMGSSEPAGRTPEVFPVLAKGATGRGIREMALRFGI